MSHFLGYRHAGYYLPGFVTLQYPEVAYAEGKRVFVMHDRDTRVVQHPAIEGFDQFIFFPLPAGDQYSEYMNGVRAKFPESTLSAITLGSRRVFKGPISALPLLFSSASGAGSQKR